MRPGCDRPVAARLTYDTVACAVWLDGPVADDEPSQQVCSVHAATLTAPLGWTVTDRRLATVVAEPPVGPPVGAAAASSPPTLEAVPERAPEAAAVPAPSTESAAAPVAAAAPAEPAADDQPAAKVVRRSRAGAERPRLLDRAFEWTGPQHSVLTQKPDDEPSAGD